MRGCRELGERRREGWRERGPAEGSRGSRVLGVVRPVLGSRGGSTAEPAACDPGENECGVSPFQNPQLFAFAFIWSVQIYWELAPGGNPSSWSNKSSETSLCREGLAGSLSCWRTGESYWAVTLF